MNRFGILYDDKLEDYNLGHVIQGGRFQNFVDHLNAFLARHPEFEVVSPPAASDDDLRLVHTDAYIQRIDSCIGLDPQDTPLSPGFVRAARLLAGAGKLAGELVQSGTHDKAFVAGGGVQHATRDREKGFGVFSDVGICAENLMRNFAVQRVLVVDTDAHAGDGLYRIFSEDPRVLLISIHQDPCTLYPGTGFPHEIGSGRGAGYSVQVPLPPGAGDWSYERVIDEIVSPLAGAFWPEVLLLVDGCDTHFSDQITDMGLTLQGIRRIGERMGRLAAKLCQGRLVDFIGSGYSRDPNLVSLGWLASLSGATGVPVDLEGIEVLPPHLKPDAGLEETMEIVAGVKKELAPYWSCFAPEPAGRPHGP